jgi:WD40 repeat protein
MIGSSIRQMAASYSSNIVAAGEFEKTVHVYDVVGGRELCQFDTGLDFGGRRLAVSDDGRLCAAGAYNRFGISLHNASNGELLWQRKDLKQVQGLRFSRRHKNKLFTFFDDRACHLLDVENGKTTDKIRGMKWTVESPFGDFQYVDEDGHFRLLDCASGRKIGRKEAHIAVDATFTPQQLVTNEFGESLPGDPYFRDPRKHFQHIVCYSLRDFSELWRLEKDNPMILPSIGDEVRDGCFQELGYCSAKNELVCVYWASHPKETRTKDLLCVDPDEGRIVRKVPLRNHPSVSTFVNKGNLLMSAEGQVVEIESGRTLHTIEVPTRDYAD